MRRVRYSVAMSLDGFIADQNEGVDWIVVDPEIDFSAIAESFDTLVMGRKTYEATRRLGGLMHGMKAYVFSRTLSQSDCPDATVSDNPTETLAALKTKPGKDIWLFGGGMLFRYLLEQGLVDTIEVTIIPILLGGGTPLLPQVAEPAKLKLTKHRTYEKTGTVSLEYATA